MARASAAASAVELVNGATVSTQRSRCVLRHTAVAPAGDIAPTAHNHLLINQMPVRASRCRLTISTTGATDRSDDHVTPGSLYNRRSTYNGAHLSLAWRADECIIQAPVKIKRSFEVRRATPKAAD
jgi:hypothetical protein